MGGQGRAWKGQERIGEGHTYDQSAKYKILKLLIKMVRGHRGCLRDLKVSRWHQGLRLHSPSIIITIIITITIITTTYKTKFSNAYP